MLKLLSKISLILFVFLIFTIRSLFAQSLEQDLNTIVNTEFTNTAFHDYKPKFLLPNSKFLAVKYNPVSLFFGSLMFVYQGYFSKQFSAGCLFSPSCSNMSKLYISEFGIIKGVFLSADRLTRCNRMAATGVHEIRINKDDSKIHENAEMFRLKQKHNHD